MPLRRLLFEVGAVLARSLDGEGAAVRARNGVGGAWYRRHRLGSVETLLVQEGQAPAALMTFLSDVLLADVSPKYVVVGQAFPLSVDLRGAAKRGGVKVAEDLETHFARKNSEGVYTDEGAELF